MSDQNKSYAFGDWTLNDILNDQRPELKDALFRVPDYQRGYAWEERQLKEFWEDLVSDRPTHYMGAVTVTRNGELDGRPRYDVVDGQQRLTTTALLLSVLVKPSDNPLFAPDDDGVFRFGPAEESEDLGFFLTMVATPVPMPSTAPNDRLFPVEPEPPAANRSQRNLLFAKSYFTYFVDRTYGQDLEARKAFASRVLAKMQFDFRVLGEERSAEIVFETMNNRGKPLTLFEKLKNRLMYLTVFAPSEDFDEGEVDSLTPETVRETINMAWGDIYRELASDPNREPLDEDEFVAAHLSVYRNPKESVYSETVAESRLFKMFCERPERHAISEEVDDRQSDAVAEAEKEDPLTLSKIESYVKDLRAFVPAWAAVHREFGSACGQCRLLSDRRETKIFLAAVTLHVGDDEALRENVFEAARQILFRNTIGAGMDRTRFATLARRLHGVCVDRLQRGQRRELDGNGVLTELRKVLDNEKKKPTKQTLVEFFADKQKGDFYGWSELGMRYFLLQHEADYSGRADGTPRLTWEMFDKVSVEHVLPQSAATKDSRGWRWWNRVVLDWNDQAGFESPTDAQLRDAAETLSGTLGNLVLLTREENSEVSSRAWETYTNRPGKRDFYLDSGHRSSNGAAALASGTEHWNAWRIRERGRELFRKLAADFGVADRWSDSEVDAALGFPDILDPNEGDYLSDRPIPRLADADVARNVRMDETEDRTRFRLPVTEDDIRTYLQRQEVDAKGQLKGKEFAKGKTGFFNLNLLRRPDGAIRFIVYAYADKQKWQDQLKKRSDWPVAPEFPENRNSSNGIVAEFAIADQNWRRGTTDPKALLDCGNSILDKLEEAGFFA